MAYPNTATTINLKDPAMLFAMQSAVIPSHRFLSSTYFAFNPTEDIFNSSKVYVSYEDKAGNELAPCVRSGFKSGQLQTFHFQEFTPARIASQYNITAEDIEKLTFGESPFSNRAAQDRAFAYGVKIQQKQTNAVRARIEKMAADLMLNNEYTVEYVKSDANGEEEDITSQTVSYVDPENANEAKVTFEQKWTDDTCDILGQLEEMILKVLENGARAGDIILGSAAAALFRNNPNVCKIFDNRRYDFGMVKPADLGDGASVLGSLVLQGHDMRLIQYAGTYYDDKQKKEVPFFDPKSVVVTAPKAGRALFAAVTQLEQIDGDWHTHANIMVPNFHTDYAGNKTSLTMTSRPVLAPIIKGCWVASQVVDAE